MTLMTVLFPKFMKQLELARVRAEDEVDVVLRYTGMRWRNADIGISSAIVGVYPHKTNELMLESALRAQVEMPRSWLDDVCYKVALWRALRAMKGEARREARRRLKVFEASLVDKAYGRTRTAGPNHYHYRPYDFVMPLEVITLGGKQYY